MGFKVHSNYTGLNSLLTNVTLEYGVQSNELASVVELYIFKWARAGAGKDTDTGNTDTDTGKDTDFMKT